MHKLNYKRMNEKGWWLHKCKNSDSSTVKDNKIRIKKTSVSVQYHQIYNNVTNLVLLVPIVTVKIFVLI